MFDVVFTLKNEYYWDLWIFENILKSKLFIEINTKFDENLSEKAIVLMSEIFFLS